MTQLLYFLPDIKQQFKVQCRILNLYKENVIEYSRSMYLYEERYCVVSCFRESKQETNSISCVFQVRESQLKGMQVYQEYKNYVLICIQRLNIKAIKVKIGLKSSFSSWILFIYSKLFRRTWTEQRQDRRISWQKDGGNIGEGRSQFWLR